MPIHSLTHVGPCEMLRKAWTTGLNWRRGAIAPHPLWIDSNSEANPSDA
jgi:hypothetical protein